MANRINGNVIIVDSAMGNAFVLNSASMIRNLNQYKVQAISFFYLSTAASVIITQANTSTDVVFNANLVPAFATGGSSNVYFFENPKQVTFPLGLRVSDIKVPTLVAGTAYLYLA